MNRCMTPRMSSSAAGVKVLLKIEDAAIGANSAEISATTTAANAWETLTFYLNDSVPGTPPFDSTFTCDRASVLFNVGTDGATADPQTDYFENPRFTP